MGYILPLPYFKERNYHNRKPISQDPFFVENKYPMEPLKGNKEKDSSNQSFYKKEKLYTPKHIHVANNEKMYAEITGKGRNVNEIV